MKYKEYLDERNSLIAAELEQARQFDKYILTLAAGTFGLSLLFVSQIAQPRSLWLLVFSWAFFGASMLVTLVSFLLSQKACEKQREIWDEIYEERDEEKRKRLVTKNNNFAGWTQGLNWVSMFLFIVGVVFLILFGVQNLL